MKTSTLIKTFAMLAAGAAFPLGTMAAPPAGITTEQGVIQHVDAAKKEFTLKGEKSKQMRSFDWNASTQFLENGKPAAASQLRSGEHATVSYTHHGKQRVATRITMSPSGKAASAHKAEVRKSARNT